MPTDAARSLSAIDDIAAERRRQVEGEGWTIEHDDGHSDGELAQAAGCYALYSGGYRSFTMRFGSGGDAKTPGVVPRGWPFGWAAESWKPSGARRDLVKAGALIVAEIERLDRAEAAKQAADGAGLVA